MYFKRLKSEITQSGNLVSSAAVRCLAAFAQGLSLLAVHPSIDSTSSTAIDMVSFDLWTEGHGVSGSADDAGTGERDGSKRGQGILVVD
jgi:hypothetical protein